MENKDFINTISFFLVLICLTIMIFIAGSLIVEEQTDKEIVGYEVYF